MHVVLYVFQNVVVERIVKVVCEQHTPVTVHNQMGHARAR